MVSKWVPPRPFLEVLWGVNSLVQLSEEAFLVDDVTQRYSSKAVLHKKKMS